MSNMRHIMTILEGRGAKTSAQPVAVNRDDLIGRLMSLQSILTGFGHGFAFTTEWVDELVGQTKRKKLDHEASEARDRADHDEADGEFASSPFPSGEVFVELADQAVPGWAARFSIHSDTRTMERSYQDRMTTDPDNPMDYIEDSDFLRFLKAQDGVAGAVDQVVPSKPSTYRGFVEAMETTLDVYGANSQDEELIWAEDLQGLVSRYIPMLRFCLKNV